MDCLVLRIFKFTILMESVLLIAMGYMIKYAVYFAAIILGIIILFYCISKKIEGWLFYIVDYNIML